MSDEKDKNILGGAAGLDRRNFMTASLAVGFGALLANFGVASMALFSPFRDSKPQPVPVEAAKIPTRGYLSVNYGNGSAFVGRDKSGGYIAFNGTCPHMSCQVRWTEEKNRFACPCHEGFFDADGNVISGPARTPMEKLPFVIDGNMVVVGKEAEKA